VSQESLLHPVPGHSEPSVRPQRARRYRYGVRGMIAIIACCAVLMWAVRTLWESQHPAIVLARGLDARKASERIAAIRSLASVGVDDGIVAIPLVMKRLADADDGVRAAAADALGLLGSFTIKTSLGKSEVRAAVAGLVGLLNDPQPAVRIAAANALGSIANCDMTRMIELEPASHALVTILDDRSTEVRLSAIRALGFVGPRGLAEPPTALVAALEDESAKVRAEAVASLANYNRGLPRIIPSLLQSMHKARSEARASYSALFGYIRPPGFSAEVIHPLILALDMDDREIRQLAASRLAAFGPGAREAVPLLIKTLAEPMEVEIPSRLQKNDDPLFREPSLAAALALGKIAPGTDLASQAAVALAKAIRSGAPACRATSIEALTYFGPEAEAVVPTLIAELRESIAAEKTEGSSDSNRDPYARYFSINSITRSLRGIAPGTPSAEKVLDVLVDILQSKSEFARYSAAQAVSRFGPMAVRAIPHLRALQHDPDAAIRRNAAQALKDLVVVEGRSP
jgi:HEAT repeat protein